MPGRLLIAALVALFAVGLVSAVWNLCDWPPPRLILRYGFPPTGGPTGRTMTIEEVEFVELEPGYFRMGSHFLCEKGDLLGRLCARFGLPWGTQPRHDGDECPPHWVEIARGFWIGRTEITNGQYNRFSGGKCWALSPGSRFPSLLTYEDAEDYCKWIASRGALDVRIPSEAEWEYACRAGSATEFCFGDDLDTLRQFAWCDGESEGRTNEVASLAPNAWGLFDMHGNVWEVVSDTFCAGRRGVPDDPFRVERIFRGGGIWPPMARSATRGHASVLDWRFDIGLRCVAEPR